MKDLVLTPEQRQQADEAFSAARQAAYRAVGLSGREVACVRYDNALAAALASLAEQGYRLVPPARCTCTVFGGPGPDDVNVEEDPACPEHGERARDKQSAARLWKVYDRLAAAMGVDVSEPFPAVDVFAEAERRLSVAK